MAVNLLKRIKREGFFNELKRIKVKFLFLRKRLGLLPENNNNFYKSFYGPYLLSNWKDTTFRFCLRGSYGIYFSDYLKSFDSPFTFIDIGANQGIYSLIAGSNKNCKSIIAFEPVNHTAEIFRKNLIRNRLIDNVRLVRKAISSTKEKIYINFNPEHTGSAGISLEQRNSPKTLIETITAEEIQELGLQIKDKVVIKIDVEGHELVVIKELIKLDLFRNVVSIYYEFDINSSNNQEFVEILKKEGFNKHVKIIDENTKDIFNIICFRDSVQSM